MPRVTQGARNIAPHFNLAFVTIYGEIKEFDLFDEDARGTFLRYCELICRRELKMIAAAELRDIRHVPICRFELNAELYGFNS